MHQQTGDNIYRRQAANSSAEEPAYRFMSAITGDYAGFEEAARALFANNPPALEIQTAHWPIDVRT